MLLKVRMLRLRYYIILSSESHGGGYVLLAIDVHDRQKLLGDVRRSWLVVGVVLLLTGLCTNIMIIILTYLCYMY